MEVSRRLGCKEAIFLKYPNHCMDAWPIVEMRARLVFLFRMLKVDTVLVYDPSALYERNPDHYVTARAVEWAAAISSSQWDYPEHFKAGLKPHAPSERYYFSRGPQLVNRVVDISDFMDRKVSVNVANVTQGPAAIPAAACGSDWLHRESVFLCWETMTTQRTANTRNSSPCRATACMVSGTA